ncbi:WbuC family cupin fold metalloprotein [Cyanobium sp. CH-040]|uniref:WbuC family cupin fold metalloprotein n=1 Tax=Cyanobium sp. CH-040 TaxID=2823708 RepID=UPI0028F45C6B|nr:WbuC family cupin fold metalloprotein [Cyanobium sp. CH-040]MCP9927002.1 WbuC family cupin fold metalloprotein [Cyanobium sp. CH-040]
MRITIVGCGYVGTALARHWRHDPQVRLTVTCTREERRSQLAPLAERVEVLRAGDGPALRLALQDAEVAVFCLAPTGDRLVSADAYGATYRDSFSALAALVDELPNLRQIVYTGSCSVYGDAGGGWVDESTPAAPRDDHGRVLLESEELLGRCRAPGRRVCVLRLGAIYGPGRELGERFRPLAGSTRPGDGRQHSSWIHRDDVVGAIAAAVNGGWDGLVNLVDDEPLPVADLLDRVLAAGALEPVRWHPAAATGTKPADRRVSNRRLHQLGHRLRHPRVQVPLLKRIDQTLFDALASQSREAPRGRCNHNLHQESDLVQRFLNVLQPGTYVRPHRHQREQPGTGFECFLVLQGAVGLLVLDAAGAVISRQRLEAGGALRGVELAEGQVHTLVALEPDTVLFELKQGPYIPSADKDFLSQFPAEGTPAAEAQERCWRALFEEEENADP